MSIEINIRIVSNNNVEYSVVNTGAKYIGSSLINREKAISILNKVDKIRLHRSAPIRITKDEMIRIAEGSLKIYIETRYVTIDSTDGDIVIVPSCVMEYSSRNDNSNIMREVAKNYIESKCVYVKYEIRNDVSIISRYRKFR